MRRHYQKLHDVSPSQGLVRWSFVLCFLLGVGGSILLKISGAHPFIVAGYAALALVLYAVIAWMSGRVGLEPENIGDNCYYLGFLFTLASLAHTLYQMADPTLNSGRPVDIPEVISGFGVALSSTILGVFLRVLLMQMRPDFVLRERQIQADLNRSFTKFKTHLSAMLRQMKAYSAESVQQAAERDERIRKDTEKFVKDHHETLQEASEEFTHRLESTLSSVTEDSLKRIADAIEVSSSKSLEAIEASGAKSIAAIEEACNEIVRMKNELRQQEVQSYQNIQNHRQHLLGLYEDEEARLKTHADEMEKYIRVTSQTADVMEKRFLGALDDKLVPTLERTIPAFTALIEHLEKLKRELEVRDTSLQIRGRRQDRNRAWERPGKSRRVCRRVVYRRHQGRSMEPAGRW